MSISYALPVLITQCLQPDFVAPLGRCEPLPNILHVGHAEAARLLGDSPEIGPLAQFMDRVRSYKETPMEIIHICDCHDPDSDSEMQKEHLNHFGKHCIKGTAGARPLSIIANISAGVDGQVSPKDGGAEHIIYSDSLSDFNDTGLGELLDSLKERPEVSELRIGVIGLWTDAKVTYLLYDLLTRGYSVKLATCSALVASASRAQHFNALEQLRKLLGVHVFDSVGEFCSWLLPSKRESQWILRSDGSESMSPDFIMDETMPLTKEEVEIASFLYRDAAKVTLNALGGGYSGAKVFQVSSLDAMGHQLSPSVLKLGSPSLIGKERVSFERLEPVLGNNAPRIKGFADLGSCAGLKYAYAAMGKGDVNTFQSLYMKGTSLEEIDEILERVFVEVLGKFYSAGNYERLPLFDYYTFSSSSSEGVRDRVKAIIGEGKASLPEIKFAEDFIVPNVADFYGTTLDTLPEAYGEYHMVSYVHGDLNGANILLDSHDNIWIIDFFHSHRGHIVRDLAKLENDILYIFTPVNNDDEFNEALSITRALGQVSDLRAPLGPLPEGVKSIQFRRAWHVLSTLRRIIGRFVESERNPQHLRIALLRYAVHTLSFDESSMLQRKWALATSGFLARAIEDEAMDQTDRLRLNWLKVEDSPLSKLGLTICPGRVDRGRNLALDLQTMVDEGVSTIVGCLTSREMDWLDVPDLMAEARKLGIEYIHEPFLDQGVPGVETMENLVEIIDKRISSGRKTIIHCVAGLGRSGTVAASLLVKKGYSADESIRLVRESRGPRAIESKAQEMFVRDFANLQK
jgi:protein-tyrosine phosphatase/nicotinamidase-related amidase